jgi:four helix bundle protein
MDEEQFKERTRQLGLRVIKLAAALPKTPVAAVIAKQIVRSATSVGANYRAACRSRSNAAMIAKLDIVLEEADETMFWIELLRDAGLFPAQRLVPLLDEANAITAMVVASLKTLRSRVHRPPS